MRGSGVALPRVESASEQDAVRPVRRRELHGVRDPRQLRVVRQDVVDEHPPAGEVPAEGRRPGHDGNKKQYVLHLTMSIVPLRKQRQIELPLWR